jgi:hypothetical protein
VSSSTTIGGFHCPISTFFELPSNRKMEDRYAWTQAASRKSSHRPALLRFEVPETAQILRMSGAQLYNPIHDGSLKPQKDGARTYITRAELERYVLACSG